MTERRNVDAALDDLSSACARAVPGASGARMGVILRLDAAGRPELCREAGEVASVRLDNCVFSGVRRSVFPPSNGEGDRVTRFQLTFDAPEVRALCDAGD